MSGPWDNDPIVTPSADAPWKADKIVAPAQAAPEDKPYWEHPANPAMTDPSNPLYAPLHRSAGQFAADIPKNLNNLARSFAAGATFGQADKMAAAAESATGIGGKSGDYQGNLASEQSKTEDIKQNAPGAYELGSNLGLAASPVTKTIGAVADAAVPITNAAGKVVPWLQRYTNYGLQGGLFNTLYQAGLGDKKKAEQSAEGAAGIGAAGMVAPEGGGAIPEVAGNFAKGVTMGVVPPAVLEGGGAVLESVLKPILSRISPEEAAIAGVGRAAERAGLEPEQLASKIEKLGPAGMPANVGGPITDYARDIAQFPGQARSQAQQAFAAQQGGRLSTSGGAVGRIEDALTGMVHPEGANAAAAFGGTLENQSAVDTAKALMEKRSQESGFKELFAEPTIPESSKLSVLGNNPVVRRSMTSGQSTATNFANASGEELAPNAFSANGKPTLQGWHAVTSDLGETISNIKRGVIPAPPDASLASLEAIHRSILGELKNPDVNPLATQFEDSLNKWSGPSAALDAINTGAKVARGDVRLTQQLLDDMTDSERQFFRIGLADQAQYLVSKTPDGANVVKSIFGNQNQRRNLEAVFDTRADFNTFRQAIARDQKFYSSQQAILGGSPTASRALGAEDVGAQIGEVAKDTMEAGKEGGVTGAGASLLKRGWNYLKSEPEAVRDAAGQMMFTTDPATKARMIEALKAQQAKGSIYGTAGSTWLPRAGVVGAAKFLGGQ